MFVHNLLSMVEHVNSRAVGATMVGSIVTLGEEGKFYTKGTCNGYFKFGGRYINRCMVLYWPHADVHRVIFFFHFIFHSTPLLFFQRGAVTFDDDLVSNSRSPIETIVRVGMRIGEAASKPDQVFSGGL